MMSRLRAITATSLIGLALPLFAYAAVFQQATGTSAAQCPNLTHSLSRGVRGNDVTALQRYLISQGFLADGSPLGFFGSATESAVKKFQCRTMNTCSGSVRTNGYGALGPKTRVFIAGRCRVSQPTTATSTKLIFTYAQGGYGGGTPPPPSPFITPPPPPSGTCTPLPSEIQTLACAAGQTGTITQTRTSTCAPGATTPTWSEWTTTGNTCASSVDNKIYVSLSGDDSGAGTLSAPFKTFERVQSRVKELKSLITGDIFVYIKAGTYYLSQPLTFSSQDGGDGTRMVTYQSYNGDKVVLSGGTLLLGWDTNADKGIYGLLVTNLFFRQIYDGGDVSQRPQRGRISGMKVLEYKKVTGSCTLDSIRLQTAEQLPGYIVNDLSGTEVVVRRSVTSSRLHVASAATTGINEITIYLTPSDAQREGCSGEQGTHAYIEGSLAALSKTGEWVLRGGVLYYKPESPAALQTTVAPRLENILTISGTETSPVRNLTFSGIEFRHTGWTAPSGVGHIGGQGGYLDFALVGAITITHARDITITKSKIAQAGASGIVLNLDTKNISITQNVLENIAGDGIVLNTFQMGNMEHNPNDPTKIISDVTIANNLLQGVGIEYEGVGIYGAYFTNSTIRNNLVRWTNYTGISSGWFELPRALPAVNTSIDHNDISEVMQGYNDGGGIYTIGQHIGLSIHDNYIHDYSYTYDGYANTLKTGIYLDGYSSEITASNNYAKNLRDGLFLQTLKTSTFDSRAKRNNISSFYMSGVTVAIPPEVLADSTKPELQNQVDIVLSSNSSIAASAGPSPAARSLWAAEYGGTPKTYFRLGFDN